MVILKTYVEVKPFLMEIQNCADKHKKEFGFLPKGAYKELALQGKLWVAVGSFGVLNGYLIFGGTKPSLKVFQMFVHPDHRGEGIASRLIKELETYGEKNCFLSIKARVAADLEANPFWEKHKFFVIDQQPGGKSRKRTINIRIKDLESPSFLENFGLKNDQCLKNFQSTDFGNHPMLSNAAYALDLNVFFDLLKKRANEADASSVFNAGWNNIVKLCVAPEFVSELERTSKDQSKDPLLQFARNLPQLRKIKEDELSTLSDELRDIVFPQRDKKRKEAKNDESDLRHLCYAIKHKLNGFVTREKAILNTRDQLLSKFGLEIVSPSDFSRTEELQGDETYSIVMPENEGKLKICTNSFISPEVVDDFLKGMRINSVSANEVWNNGVVENQQRHLSAHYNEELIAVGSWIPPIAVAKAFNAYLFVEEEQGNAIPIIDHFLEGLLRDVPYGGLYQISLIIGKSQTETLSTAINRGFVVNQEFRSSSVIKLIKYTFGGFLDQKSWSEFVHGMSKFRPDMTIPEELPLYEEFKNTGIILKKHTHPVRLFDFESIFSPGITLPKGRDAMLVPIKQPYADQLVGRVNDQLQLDLIPEKPALLSMERAYFRSPRKTSGFKRGVILIFYVSASKEGGKELLGWARLTSSQLMHTDDVKIRLSRQGVLSEDELLGCANKDGIVHAFTFDNFSRFPKKIQYTQLKGEGFIDGANLVTAQPLPSKKLEALCNLIY